MAFPSDLSDRADHDRRWVARSLRLIAAAAFLVPADRRWEWQAEWTAEVEHRAQAIERQWLCSRERRVPRHAPRAAGPRLFLRTAGCIPHACWLRRDEWRLQMIWQDVRYGLRVLMRRPAFTVLSTITLALAIGALTAVFSVVYGVLLRPLPYHQPDRLVQIWENNPVKGWQDNVVAPANLLDWRARSRTFEGITCYIGSGGHNAGTGTPTLTGSGDAETVRSLDVCVNIFDVLGVSPALGHGFTLADATSAEAVIAISDAFWRRRFGARPDIIGQTIRLNGVPTRIAGVMPPDLRLPGADVDVWQAFGVESPKHAQNRRPHYLRAIGRMKPGVTIEQAREDIQRVARQLSSEYPDTNKTMGADIGSLQEWIVGGIRRKLLLFLAAVGFVLLIACTNVASLLMAQSIERARELALRAALGAKRSRVIRQLVTESLLLSIIGSITGVVLAMWAVRAFVALGPADVPRLADVKVDGVMLAFAIAAGVATTLVFGLLPAAHAARLDVMPILREGGRSASAGLRSQRARRLLVAAEVTLSVMLVICAGLLIRSFIRVQQVDPGVKASNLLTFQLSLPQVQYPKDEQAIAFYDRLLAQLEALPGVRAAGTTTKLALTGTVWTGDSTIEGRPPDEYIIEVRHKTVSNNYFNAAGLHILQGRGFLASDAAGAAQVVIVNHTLARKYFAREDPVGRRITFAKPSIKADWLTIVGVVDDERQDGLTESIKPEIYQPMGQDAWLSMSVALRTDVDPESLIAPVRQLIRTLNPDLVVQKPQTFDTLIATSVSPQRFSMLLMSAFATIALLLAVIGVYGVVSYGVKQRTSEIGVRLALGASPRQVSRLIVQQSLTPVFIGLLAGLVLASLMTRLLSNQLFEISPIDPATFGVVSIVLLSAAMLASVIPARRAMRVDPVDALRAE
jgi:putative ABC transport system permease protein